MTHRRLPIRTALLTVVALLGVSACGADSDPVAPTPQPSVASPAASGSATPSASPSHTPVKASSNTSSITATGAYGKEPKVTFKAPFAIDKTQARVLEPNKDGAVVSKDQTITFDYYAVNARTGKTFDNSFASGRPISFPLGQLVPGFAKGLVGQHQGSRVLLAITGPDGYDGSGGNADAGIEVGDTLIFVVDVVGVPLTDPKGAAVAPVKGLPIVTDKAGEPSITVPKTSAPTKLVAQPLIKGAGAKVTAADTLTINYRWVKWSDGQLLEETYSTKAASAPLNQLLPGMQKGLVDQTVGSRVLLVIPPADGYPEGNAEPKINKGETLVMVVDILFAAATPGG